MRRIIKIILALIILLTFYVSLTFSQSLPDKFMYTVKVLDTTGRVVDGVEIVVLSVEYDIADGRIIREPVDKKITDSNGTTTINLDFSKYQDVCIVAWEKSLAVTWDYLDKRSLPVDKSEIVMILEKPSELSGTVVDENGAPVAGARLRAELDSRYLQYEHRINAPEEWLTVQTDEKGHFCFNNIPPDGVADFLVTAPGKANLYTFMASDTMPGARYAAGRTDIRIVLPDEAKIQGKVVDSAGNPVAGIKLLARPDKGVGNYYCTNRTISGEDGRFILENVAADTYFLHIVPLKEKLDPWVGRGVKVVVEAGQIVDNVVVGVNKGGLVEVIVLDAATGRGIGDVFVSVLTTNKTDRQSYFYQSTRTGRSGIARVRAPLGQARLVVTGKDWSRFEDKIIVKKSLSRFRVKLYRDPQVWGIVRDQAGQVVSNAVVTVVPNGNGAVRTDANGRFRVGLEVQSKEACIFARDEQRNLAGVTELRDLNRPVEIIVKPALIFSGRVTDPNGRSIPVARVQFVNLYAGWLSRIGGEVITDANGRFEIPAIPPPQEDFSYRLSFRAAGYGSIRYERIKIPESASNQIDLNSFVLQPLESYLTISGIVVDSDGKTVPDKIVNLSGPSGGTEQPKRHIVTDAEGWFFFNRLCKGPLRLQAGWASEGDVGYLNAKAGDKNVKMVLGQERIHTDLASLIGKPLPELGEFGLRPASEVAAGKKVLVCFWDLNQRPSRNCVQRLSRDAKLLNSKGVYIVSVLTVNIPDMSLAAELKKYGITVPTGMIKDDIAEFGRTWGVQSQPWLILTDRNHIVRVEGFGLDELDEKIREAENAKR